MLIDVNGLPHRRALSECQLYQYRRVRIRWYYYSELHRLTAPIAKFNATILDTDSPIDITISDAG